MRAGRVMKVVTVLWLLTSLYVVLTVMNSKKRFNNPLSDWAFFQPVVQYDEVVEEDVSWGSTGLQGAQRSGGLKGRGGAEGTGLTRKPRDNATGNSVVGVNNLIPVESYSDSPLQIIADGVGQKEHDEATRKKRKKKFHRKKPVSQPLPVTSASATRPLLLSYSKYKRDAATSLWPVEQGQDRVINQIFYYKPLRADAAKKLIFVPAGFDSNLLEGQSRFIDHECPIDACSITFDRALLPSADLVLHKDYVDVNLPTPTNPNQVGVLFLLESPSHTSDFSDISYINWTASYRTDSVLNAPYERFTYFNNFTALPYSIDHNYAAGKTKKVAWFVSNCQTSNGREAYAAELAKHISVDIYGACGSKRCTRGNSDCFPMLKRDYKFYLSFENSNCKDYITEKFFVNALSNDIIPIVMGAPEEDYKRLAPPESFIHVDSFESPKELSKYLHRLDQDDVLYNRYFRWKGSGEMIDTKFWCRLCHMIHHRGDLNTKVWYSNVERWWRGEGVCKSKLDLGTDWVSWRGVDTHRVMKSLKNTFHLIQST